MRRKDSQVAAFPRREGAAEAPAARTGHLVSFDPAGVPTVEIPGAGQVPARLAMAATPEQLIAAISARQEVVLVFENGDIRRPLIVGFVQVPQPLPAQATPTVRVLEADVDGKRVRITAADEVVFECGTASITLRRNGRVIIRGTYVETHSEGTNRIKGGQVQIN